MRGARSLATLVLALVALRPASARGESVTASASCERKTAKGRVVCDVEVETDAGRIAWADVVVVEAPPFAPPLRSRVGIADARTRTERRVRIPVAFVATGLGKGAVLVRARVVVCRPEGKSGAESCVPDSREARAELVVGSDLER